MESSASSSSRQHSNIASSCASSSLRQRLDDSSSRASSSSRQHLNDASSCASSSSNDASSCLQIELWCDHCAWRVKGQRFDDGKVCCAFCGKILQDTTFTNYARGQKRSQGTGDSVNVASCKTLSTRALQSVKYEKG